ncbi:type II toxin-antitoxin system RelE/ParE family toxin [Coraliomargarita sp. SDUM461004]|uniref:Type II toxin-antitoxin system RelE/ParE family toxin n=1 Tax=Thalassobacterium sedimentorum TaxID=3041258 RepID=A0ABU1AP12_9BACT|nr:type II toxin-antitoxin system RelE/ParE family toxin [Coraliomargarita sp. SDUM461004]MDQ8196414.1 type II toxin-antitoxin system RelE/ParE family toxin [Coraliomargarita sp. SDUM461004]
MAQVIWTEPALNALDEIADYIALDDYNAASRLVQKVFKKVDLLEANPKLGNIPKELRSTPYRRLVINPVYVYYRIENDTAIIIFIDRAEREFEISRFAR